MKILLPCKTITNCSGGFFSVYQTPSSNALSFPTPGLTTPVNANHSKEGKINTKFSKNLNIQPESVLLHLLVSSFLLFTLMNLECPHLTKRGPVRGNWDPAQVSELGRVPVPSSGKQAGTKGSRGFSAAAAPCLSPISWSHR